MSIPAAVLTPYKPGLFSGKGVIVTGGGTGLGFAIGKSLTHSFLSYPRQTSQEPSMLTKPSSVHHAWPDLSLPLLRLCV